MSSNKRARLSGNATDRIDTPTARDRLQSELRDCLWHEETGVIDAPTSLGKSYAVATTPWRNFSEITGGEPVIHLHQTRQARDDAAEMSAEAGIAYDVLKSRTETCPCAEGRHDDIINTPDGSPASEYIDWKCDVEGIPFWKVHSRLQKLNDDYPCSPCQGVRQWRDVPRDGDGDPTADVVHATASFAHVETFIEDANVIFDERPSFTDSFDESHQDNFRRAFTEFMSQQVDGTLRWEAFVTHVRGQDSEHLDQYRELLTNDPDDEYLFGRHASHQSAATLGRALLNAEETVNGRLAGWDERTGVVLNDHNDLSQVHRSPPLENARCIIGLDAYPVEPLWRLNTVEDLEVRSVLSSDERRSWRRHERGLEAIQVGQHSNYVSDGWNSRKAQEKIEQLVEALRDEYGEAFRTSICGESIESDVEEMLEEAGVEEPDTMHYGKQKSRNDFEEESVGLLVGCIDPGDEYVLDMVSLCGLSAEPEPQPDGDGRAVGRGFVGSDGDKAEEILASVRRDNVAQALGRYARHPDSDESGATVYVWTDVLPDGMVNRTVSEPQTTVTEKAREIETYVQENSSATTTEITENVSSSRPHVIEVLGRMAEQGLVTKHPGAGPHGADRYEYASEGGRLQPTVDLGE